MLGDREYNFNGVGNDSFAMLLRKDLTEKIRSDCIYKGMALCITVRGRGLERQ